MLRLTLASIRLYRRRYTATALAIVLGVAFCAATFAVTEATKTGLGNALVVQYSAADVVVQDPGSGRAALVDDLQDLPEVSALTVADYAYLPVQWPGSAQPSFVSVGEIAADPELRWQHLDHGAFPTGAGEVAVTESLADDEGIAVGDRVTVGDGALSQQAEVVGILDSVKGAMAPEVFAADGVAEDWSRAGGSTELLLKAASGTSPDELAQLVSSMTSVGEVHTTDELRTQATSSLTDDVDLLGLMFQAFAAIALFVAALVIANTFSIVLAQRSRDLAMMRCVGALRRQVMVGVVGEALVLGVVASLIGTAVGLGLAAALIAAFNQTALPVPMQVTAPALSALLIPLGVGIVITVLAAIGPARRATRIAPLAALRPQQPEVVRSRPGAVRLAVAAVLLAAGAIGLSRAMSTYSLLTGVAAGSVLFLGVLALAPVIVPALLRVVAAVQVRLPRQLRGGVPGTLSVANSLRNPKRTTATTSALLIGVTLISLLAVGASSLETSAATAIDRNHPVDVVVSSSSPLSQSLVDEVRDTDGIADVVPLMGLSVPARHGHVLVASVDAAAANLVVRDAVLRDELASQRAIVPPNYGNLTGYGSRQTISLAGVELRVSNVAAPSGPVLVPSSAMSQLTGRAVIGGLWVRVADGQDAVEVMRDLDTIVADSGSEAGITGGYIDRSTIARALDIMLLVATGLLGMAIVIALVGVSNTLSLSVIERTREQALLRALGMTKRQQRLMLAAEALLMSALAAGLGVVLGIGFGWAATVTAIGNVTQQPAVLDVPWGRLALVVVAALMAGLAASVLPARRASRIAPASALAEA